MTRKRQYLGQRRAMAARRRRVRMTTSQQPCRITMKFIRCPITFTVIRKQIWGGGGNADAQPWGAASGGTSPCGARSPPPSRTCSRSS